MKTVTLDMSGFEEGAPSNASKWTMGNSLDVKYFCLTFYFESEDTMELWEAEILPKYLKKGAKMIW